MTKTAYLRNVLGITHKEEAHILNVSPNALSNHESEFKRLLLEAGYLLDLVYKYSKLANEDREDFHTLPKQNTKQKNILKILKDNERQQKVLFVTIALEERSQNQKLTKQALLTLINGVYNSDSDYCTKLKSIVANVPKPQFEKELYHNHLRLKTLKYEERLLEKELQQWIANCSKDY